MSTFKKISATVDLDALTRKHSAFENFEALLNTHPSYRPTIFVDNAERIALADAYDAAMLARGDERRAYRAGRGR